MSPTTELAFRLAEMLKVVLATAGLVTPVPTCNGCKVGRSVHHAVDRGISQHQFPAGCGDLSGVVGGKVAGACVIRQDRSHSG